MNLETSQQWENHYQPTKEHCWQGRKDHLINSLRFHEVVEVIDLHSALLVDNEVTTVAFVGFCCDEGVKRNQGRPGAFQGPDALRQALGPLPIGVDNSKTRFIDVGNIICADGDMESAQQSLARVVANLLTKGVHPILFGGGHEIAWGHYQALKQVFPSLDCSIINFDAHFDLRPLEENGLGSSGTPFRQIADDCLKNDIAFDYTCIGTQPLGNTPALFAEAKRLKTHIIDAEEICLQGIDNTLEAVETALKRRKHSLLSLCLDLFSSSVAPGVSAPQPLGLMPWHILPLIRAIAKSGNSCGMHIAELNPSLDIDQRTAKLAANLVATYIQDFNP